VESRARVLGHSLHQILIAFPLGLLVTSVGFDAMALVTGAAQWLLISYYTMIVGLLTGGVAAIAGAIDYFAIPAGTRAKRVGLVHGSTSLVMLLLFAMSAFLRTAHPLSFHPAAFTLSLIGLMVSGLAGWLGGELVTRMGVGVADGAHLNAEMTSLRDTFVAERDVVPRHRMTG